ncbi:hypothetical protein GC175_17085 [bacterium]|nr:hypothetical protein [bacterium]
MPSMQTVIERALHFTPVGTHQTDDTVSAATTLTPPNGANSVLLQALNQNVRYTLNGTTPTATTGFRLTAGRDPVIVPMTEQTMLRVIEEVAGAVLQYQWGA